MNAASARRRARSALGIRLRRFAVALVVVVAALVWLGAWLAARPEFRLHSIRVAGAATVPEAEIIARAAIPRDENLWLLDLRPAIRRIDAIPRIESARIERSLPANVAIDVRERVATGCVRAGFSEVTIDATFRVLDASCAASPLPRYDIAGTSVPAPGRVVRSAALERLVADVGALRQPRRFVSFRLDRFGSLEAATAGGTIVRFGDDRDIGREEAILEPILAGLPDAQRIAAIDLRAPGAPAIVFRRDPQAQDVQDKPHRHHNILGQP